MQALIEETHATEGGILRRLLLLAAVSMVVMLAFAPAAMGQSRGPSGADGTYNCEDFDDQGQAQEFFNSDPGDSNGLDDDDDGLACETLPTVVNDGTPYGYAVPGEGESETQGQQYEEQPVAAPSTSTSTGGALPATGGLSPLLPASVLLVGSGIFGLVIARRSS